MMRRALGALLAVLVCMPPAVLCARCLVGQCDEPAAMAAPEHEMADCHAVEEPPPCHAESAPSTCADDEPKVVQADCCDMSLGSSLPMPVTSTETFGAPGLTATEHAEPPQVALTLSLDRRPAAPPPKAPKAPIYTLYSSLLI